MAEQKINKMSIYFKDTELRRDIELLAEYDCVSLTETFTRALRAYTQSRAEDLEFLHGQEQARQERKQQKETAPSTY